jgi:hypothetical protein
LKRLLLLLLLVLLLAAHIYYWYLPRERALAPPPPDAAGAPLQGLAPGAYDLCVWIPYPHQNLGVLAAAVADLPEVIAAAGRLSRREASAGARGGGDRGREPQALPTFGPFEVPPADEIVACTDLAGGRLRVVARIYPVLSLVAKAAGHLAGNPWLAGGEAGRMRIHWEGRLWSVTAGPDRPPAPPAPQPGGADLAGPRPVTEPAPGSPAAGPPLDLAQPPGLPPSLAIVRWAGARAEIPAGWYALTRNGPDLVVSLVRPPDRDAAHANGADSAPAMTGAALIAAVGADWQGALPIGRTAPSQPQREVAGQPPPPTGPRQSPQVQSPTGTGYSREGGEIDPTRPMWTDALAAPPAGSPAPAAPSPAGSPAPAGPLQSVGSRAPAGLPPAALALFENGSSRLTSLGTLPGLAVFNVAAAGRERWGLPAAGIFRLAAGRLPAADLAGWHILALDTASLRQAEAIAPRLAALVPPDETAAAGTAPRLSLGVWLDPRATLRIVTRIRTFVEGFPLASRPEVQRWRDWEAVLDPLGRCDHAVLTATTAPPALRLLLQGCTTVIPHPEEP